MTALVVIAVIALIAFFVLKTVRVTEGPARETMADVKSAQAREKMYGEARLRRDAVEDVQKRPRAEKLWARVGEKIEALSESARRRGIEVSEVDLGVQLTGEAETFFLQVDYSRVDPEFLIWTEENDSDTSSGLSRVRQIRAIVAACTLS